MKPHMFDSTHFPHFKSLSIFNPRVRENLKYLAAFVIGLPLAVAGAAYLIDAMVTLLVQ